VDELLCYASEHGIVGQIKEFFKPSNIPHIMKNIVNYMTIALLHKQEDLAILYLDSITQKFPDHLKRMTHDKNKLAELSNLIVLSAQNGMHRFLANFLSQFPELVNSRNVSGVSAVHAAAQSGNLATLRLLIETHKADADSRDKLGYTPLHFAAQSGNNDMVEYLAKFCDISATTNNRFVYSYLYLYLYLFTDFLTERRR
jgi:ankyrin repeat protein